MSEHTPGPWGWDDGHVFKRNPDGTSGGSIAHVYETGHNDAALIAAAPDLLDMLEACIDSQECNGYIGVETMREAREAIAKATGEEVVGHLERYDVNSGEGI